MARSASGKGEGEGGTRVGESVVADGLAVSERFRSQLGAGSVIDGKYRLERLLGEGGMGMVWRAHHLQLDLPVAIKLLLAGTEHTNLSERLKIEARAAAQLVHPAIVRVFDVDMTEAQEPFIVMELLSGESLSGVLDRGRLAGVSAVQILLPIAEALALAHSKGIVHRDLKPHNVFMAEEGDRLQPKLLDFGIAKLTVASTLDGGLTDTGIPIGSPDYMSPEQARGLSDVDYRADIWSFCVVLYEAVKGDTPFAGDNYNALMRAIVENEPAPLALDENVDQGLADLILWGLAKDRAQRPSSMQELGRELARWLLDRGIKEDVCGSALGPKWITRTAQKSVPVIQADVKDDVSDAPKLLEATSTATLVSPRLPSSAIAARSPAPVPAPVVVPKRRRAWAVGAAIALVLALGLSWALSAGRPSPPESGAARPGALPVLPGEQAASAAPVEIAPLPPAPSGAEVAAGAVPAASAERSNSVPTAVGSARLPKKTPDAKSQRGTSKSPPAVQSARERHDGTRELLQAY